ncbi:hypothetical protein [Campylobacter troglodytis]|uniref:hypothetical protein n=1 Tax=Campylobacter troglodytis TaxID=654363 RepID=UPI001159CAE9|nr:hypothetical protein [Campylobacter troglodytis]
MNSAWFVFRLKIAFNKLRQTAVAFSLASFAKSDFSLEILHLEFILRQIHASVNFRLNFKQICEFYS